MSGASQIPTVLYYDKLGRVRAVGAEAMTEGIFEQVEAEHWNKAEWCDPQYNLIECTWPAGPQANWLLNDQV